MRTLDFCHQSLQLFGTRLLGGLLLLLLDIPALCWSLSLRVITGTSALTALVQQGLHTGSRLEPGVGRIDGEIMSVVQT